MTITHEMIPVLVIKCFVSDVIQWMELPCPSGFSSVGFARARHLDSACLSVPRSPRDGGTLFQYGKPLDVQVGQENMHTQTHLCYIYIYNDSSTHYVQSSSILCEQPLFEVVAPASFGLEVLKSWHSLMPQPWRFLVAGDGSKPGPRQPAGDYTQIEAQSEDVHMKTQWIPSKMLN